MTSIFNNGKIELTCREKKWFEENKEKTIILVVSHYGESEKAAAVRVMTNAPSRNKYKHITLGTNIENGGKPVDSNYILKWELTEPLILTGHVKIWYKKRS
jgi:hypothetical protein